MAYSIELISLGKDQNRVLQEVVDSLNQVQQEFLFSLPPLRLLDSGFSYDLVQYVTGEVFDWLEDYRKKAKGNRQFLVAFIGAPLRSKRLTNLFGSHRASEGLAVVTTSEAERYADSAWRFVTYYLIRYALSFVDPTATTHEETRDCFFDKKRVKADIRKSMNSGCICDQCRKAIQQRVTPEIHNAISAMTDILRDEGQCFSARVVSAAEASKSQQRPPSSEQISAIGGDHPSETHPFETATNTGEKLQFDALIMKGGGVKGLALAGAVRELEPYCQFDTYVGTSAGAIAATLLAVGYTADQLECELRNKDFREFLDGRVWLAPFNILAKGGVHSGVPIQEWLRNLIFSKTDDATDLRMQDLPALNGRKHAIVYAATYNGRLLPFDSRTSDAEVHFAVRCSMSIPIFFQPARVNGRRAFDGGMLANFPVRDYIERERRASEGSAEPTFVGLYLGTKKPQPLRQGLIGAILDIWLGQDERRILKQFSDEIVVIDPSPVSTVQFSLSDDEKKLLVLRGRVAAIAFLRKRSLPGGPTDDYEAKALADLKECESRVEAAAGKRHRRTRLTGTALLLLLVVSAGVWWARSAAIDGSETDVGILTTVLERRVEFSSAAPVELGLVPDGQDYLIETYGISGDVIVEVLIRRRDETQLVRLLGPARSMGASLFIGKEKAVPSGAMILARSHTGSGVSTLTLTGRFRPSKAHK